MHISRTIMKPKKKKENDGVKNLWHFSGTIHYESVFYGKIKKGGVAVVWDVPPDFIPSDSLFVAVSLFGTAGRTEIRNKREY